MKSIFLKSIIYFTQCSHIISFLCLVMYDIRSIIHIYLQYIRASTIHMFLYIFVRTFAFMHIQPRSYVLHATVIPHHHRFEIC